MNYCGSEFEVLAGIGTWQFNIKDGSLIWSELMFELHELNKEAELTHEIAMTSRDVVQHRRQAMHLHTREPGREARGRQRRQRLS